MGIDVNAIDQTVVVTAVGDEVNVNVIDQPVLVSVTDQIIEVEASGGTGPQGPAGAGVAAGGTTGQVLSKASSTNYDTVWVDAGAGTVYSVNASGSTGISVTGGPITGAGTLTITNTAPDQVVSLSGTGGTVITGTYPNFTIYSDEASGYVPYTGALQNVDLGEYELKAGQLTLDVSPTGTAAVGTTRWNNTIGSSETTLKGGNVVLKNGVDLVARVVNKVSPNTTLTKAEYQAVRISGAQGQRLAIELAQGNNDNNSADTIGLVTETIAPNQEGFIITVGQLENINTTGSLQGETWVDGDVLYLSPTTAGKITNVKPVAPQHLVIIGYVEYAHQNNGKIYVKTTNGFELGELHDVNTSGATNGQVLKYNGTIWTPSSDVGITSLNGLNPTSQTFATGTSGTDFAISSATSTHTFNLPTASATNRGALSSSDWSTFNNKQSTITLTTSGSSGASTFISNTLNIPTYTLSGLGGVPSTRQLTINGTAYDLSADRSWSVGTVTSVDLSVPTGFTIANNPITTSGTLAIAFASGYSLPTTSSQTNWDAAYNDKINSASVTGTTTKTLTLTQQDGGTITASWTDINTDAVTSVFGRTGAVVATSGDYTTTLVTEGTNLYYTDVRVSANSDVAANTAARHNAVTLGTANGLSLSTQQLSLALASSSANGALSSSDWTTFNNKQGTITLTTTGSSGASTFISNTLNIPTYTLSGLGGVPTTRTLTINGTAYDLSANRTWNVGTVTTAAATTAGQVAFFNGATVITSVSGLYFDGVDKLGIATTSPAYNLDVTGTARMTGNLTAASIIKSGGTSSQYLMADGSTSTLTNPVTGTGTTNYLPKWTSGTALGNSAITDDGTTVALLSRALSGTSATFTGVINVGTSGSLSINAGSAATPLLKQTTNYTELYRQGGGVGIYLGGSADLSNYYDNDTHIFRSVGGGAERMRLTSTGLGIGTTSPQAKLHIAQSSSAVLFAQDGTTATIVGTDSAGTASQGLFLRGFPLTFTGNGGGSAAQMTLNASGNLGLGVVPSAWASNRRAFQIGSYSSIVDVAGYTIFGNNTYHNGTNNYYLNNGGASEYYMQGGQHIWNIAASGTAGNAISFTQAMTLDASGRLSIGTTAANNDLNIYNTNNAGISLQNSYTGTTGSDGFYIGQLFQSTNFLFRQRENADIIFDTNATERLRITSGGSLGLGTTAPNLFAGGTAFSLLSSSGYGGIEIMGSGSTNGGQIDFGSGTTRYASIVGEYSSSTNGLIIFRTTRSGTITEAMRITSGGDVGIGTTTPFGTTTNRTVLSVNGTTDVSLNVGTGGTQRAYLYAASTYADLGTIGSLPIVFSPNNTERMRIKADGKINFSSLPTSATGLSAGDIWNDGGTLKIV